MDRDLLRIGDEVVIEIPKENREAGYNPCPDGTKATVLRFADIFYGRLQNFGNKPGVYVNRAWVQVRLPDGTEYFEYNPRLSLSDRGEYQRRLSEFEAQPDKRRKKEFIRELPHTPFWEGDIVRVKGRTTGRFMPGRDPDVFQIIKIDYDKLAQITHAGTAYPAYSISSEIGAGWSTSASQDEMELVEHGPVWKFYHDEPIQFTSLKEEAKFFQRLGHTQEVRNPENSLYVWTKEEVLAAIASGLVHGFSVSSGFLGTGPRINAIRFNNEDLGQRVAKATLEGFRQA